MDCLSIRIIVTHERLTLAAPSCQDDFLLWTVPDLDQRPITGCHRHVAEQFLAHG
jgi:hypothetical protein